VIDYHSSKCEGLTLVLGGARSGKSRYAETVITSLPPPWTYVATAQALDEEMATRIAAHRSRRNAGWKTIEAPHDIVGAVSAAPVDAAILIDCLTLWLSNRMLAGADVDAEVDHLEHALVRHTGTIVLVSNEVGSGIVPDNALARRFGDLQGRFNQRLAARANRVVLLVAGLPIFLKGDA